MKNYLRNTSRRLGSLEVLQVTIEDSMPPSPPPPPSPAPPQTQTIHIPNCIPYRKPYCEC
eukprot:1636739-Rhodomonas_salina.1